MSEIISPNSSIESLLEVKNLSKWFPIDRRLFGSPKNFVKAVDGVSFSIRAGDTLGIVGESGCGKSTLARILLRLIEPTLGEIYFNGVNFTQSSKNELLKLRRNVQIIFQDPYASLNPRQRVGSLLSEPFIIHKLTSKKDALVRAEQLLDIVSLSRESIGKYPHEFSGGQRQRLCIARALAINPKMLVCDECVSALDVSIQAQIINLLVSLQRELGITLIFISHDLRVIRHISTNVAVMYLGRVVEYAPKINLFNRPHHPYTKSLLSAVPIPNPDGPKKRIILTGDIPSPINVPPGCAFHTRCYMARPECSIVEVKLEKVGDSHYSSCPFTNPEDR